MASLLFDVFSQRLSPPKDTQPSFTGRNVIITGSNTGVGFEAAVKFVQFGANRVILGVRNAEKGEKAKAAIEDRTGKMGVVEVWQLDMLDYASVKAFAAKATETLEHLDIACLNAGVFVDKYETSQYGWERTLQVNLLSTVLLSLLLLPKLKASKTASFTPVLELVSSVNHTFTSLSQKAKTSSSPLAAYNTPSGFFGAAQYGVSKLMLQYAQTGLVKLDDPATGAEGKKQPPAVEIVAVCPGATRSEIARDLNAWYARAFKATVYPMIMKTTEQGSRTYISGVALQGEGHGRFYHHDRIRKPAGVLVGSENEKLQAKVWDDILQALRKDVPEIDGLVSST